MFLSQVLDRGYKLSDSPHLTTESESFCDPGLSFTGLYKHDTTVKESIRMIISYQIWNDEMTHFFGVFCLFVCFFVGFFLSFFFFGCTTQYVGSSFSVQGLTLYPQQ